MIFNMREIHTALAQGKHVSLLAGKGLAKLPIVKSFYLKLIAH